MEFLIENQPDLELTMSLSAVICTKHACGTFSSDCAAYCKGVSCEINTCSTMISEPK